MIIYFALGMIVTPFMIYAANKIDPNNDPDFFELLFIVIMFWPIVLFSALLAMILHDF